MRHERANKWVWVLSCSTLMLVLLSCGGPALLARSGSLPSFDADIQLWQGTTLTLHSRSARACGTAAHCPYQIKIESALTIWLIREIRQHGKLETLGQRLLYIPMAEPLTR